VHATLKRFWHDESGAEMLEWAVVTIILLSFTAVALIALKSELIDLYRSIFDKLQEDPPDEF